MIAAFTMRAWRTAVSARSRSSATDGKHFAPSPSPLNRLKPRPAAEVYRWLFSEIDLARENGLSFRLTHVNMSRLTPNLTRSRRAGTSRPCSVLLPPSAGARCYRHWLAG